MIVGEEEIELNYYPNPGSHIIEQEFGVYSNMNAILKSGVSQEIQVNHQYLQENQNYMFNLTKKKQLRRKFVEIVGGNHQIKSVVLSNYGHIP